MLSTAACNLMQALLLTGGWDDIEQVYASASNPEAPDEDPVLAYGVVLLRSFRHDGEGVAALLPTISRWTNSEDPQDVAEAATALAAAAIFNGDYSEAPQPGSDGPGVRRRHRLATRRHPVGMADRRRRRPRT